MHSVSQSIDDFIDLTGIQKAILVRVSDKIKKTTKLLIDRHINDSHRSGFHSTYIAIGVVLISILFAGGATFLKMSSNQTIDLPIPTLNLEEAKVGKSSLSARLIGDKVGVPLHLFTKEEAAIGFTAPQDTHVVFDCPEGTNASVDIAHGDKNVFETARYWGYEYTGDEIHNKKNGLTGIDMFNGRFWLSDGELEITGSQYGYLNTVGMDMATEKRYYLMTSIPLRVSCIDTDNDDLNNAREDTNSNDIVDTGETDKNLPDTDGGGVHDGQEILNGTDPTNPLDDYADFCGDGIVGTDKGEECDDGNIDVLEDGCSQLCKIDNGWSCTGEPSTCTVPCGDGMIVADLEECDDGNIDVLEDGCSQLCKIDNGWSCTGEPSVCEYEAVPELEPEEGDLGNDLTIITPASDVTWTSGVLEPFYWSAPVNPSTLYPDYIDQFHFELSIDGGAWTPFTTGAMTAYRNLDDNFEIHIGSVIDEQQCLDVPFCSNFDAGFPRLVVRFCNGRPHDYSPLECDGASVPQRDIALPDTVQSVRLQITDADNSALTDISPNISPNISLPVTVLWPLCGSNFTDHRNSKEYATVIIGTQCWMAENLNYGTRVNGSENQTNNSTAEKYCYSNSESSCDTYGGLYQWEEAMDYGSSCNGSGEGSEVCATPVQGLCPEGWHIPSHYEYTALERAVCTSGTCASDFPYDTSTTGYRGTYEGNSLKQNQNGESGFEGLLAGFRSTNELFIGFGSSGNLWSSTASGNAWGRYLLGTTHATSTTVYRGVLSKTYGLSVRCLKD